MQHDTQAHLVWFTHREDQLLKQITERGLKLPERLFNWRFWIGDSAIYINELSNFIETSPKQP
jgi:hypothetical protein